MKIKTLVAVLLLSGGVTSAFAQTEDCNKNSSISHEAVRAGNFKDAYLPWKEVLKACPTLRYYTFSDGQKILRAFLSEIKDRNSADYKKYFDELMELHDLKMKYIPEFIAKGTKLSTSVDGALGAKALDYIALAPKMDVNQAYNWFKQSVDAEKGNSEGAILHYFLDMSLNKLKIDTNHKEQFIQDYLFASGVADGALKAATKENDKKLLKVAKDNIDAFFINSGVATCDNLQAIYAPKVEQNKTNLDYLKQVISVMQMLNCTEQEAYFAASEAAHAIEPTAETAVGCGYMYYKKGDMDKCIDYFDQAINLEQDPLKKADYAYKTAAILFSKKQLSKAKQYALKSISLDGNNGKPYILIANMYASSPNWSDEAALNKCTYFAVIDKLQKAKSVDPSVAEEANKLIGTYAAHTPKDADLFFLSLKKGDSVTIGGWIGETTTIR